MTETLRFGIAATPEELDEVFRLRYRVAVEYGWGGGDVERSIEREEADEHALQFAVHAGNDLVATARLIVEPDAVAEIFHDEGLGGIAAQGSAVFGRLTVVRPYRQRTREIFVGLAAELARACVRRGIVRAVSFAAENSTRFCRLHGLPVRVAGEPRDVDGELRSPVVVDLDVFDQFVDNANDEERGTLGQSIWTAGAGASS